MRVSSRSQVKAPVSAGFARAGFIFIFVVLLARRTNEPSCGVFESLDMRDALERTARFDQGAATEKKLIASFWKTAFRAQQITQFRKVRSHVLIHGPREWRPQSPITDALVHVDPRRCRSLRAIQEVTY